MTISASEKGQRNNAESHKEYPEKVQKNDFDDQANLASSHRLEIVEFIQIWPSCW